MLSTRWGWLHLAVLLTTAAGQDAFARLDGMQFVFSADRDSHQPTASARTLVLPLEQDDHAFDFSFFFTNISIGNPPQLLTLALGLGHGAVAVRSVGCPELFCGRPGPYYNASASSTAQNEHQEFELCLGDHCADGDLYKDDIHLLTSSITDATFGAAQYFEGEDLVKDMVAEFCDGIIGLAPPNATSLSYPPHARRAEPVLRPNFLSDLMTSEAFDHKIMALHLPKNSSDQGSVVFGREYQAVNHRVRLIQGAAPTSLVDTWRVQLTAISCNAYNTSEQLNLELDIPAAVTLEPVTALTLPSDVVDKIWEHTGATPFDGDGRIECDDRDKLPDLHLVLDDQIVHLTWEDYTMRLDAFAVSDCIVAVEKNWRPERTAILGLSLLRKFDLVFDLEQETFGLIRVGR